MREEGKMSKMIDIKVKDQFSQVTEVKPFCRVLSCCLKANNLQIFIALSNNLISELQIGRKKLNLFIRNHRFSR